MRRRTKWSRGSGGAIVVVLVIVVCAGLGMAATTAARSTAARAAAARHRAQEIAAATELRARERAAQAAERAELTKALVFLPPSGTTDVPLNSPVVVVGGVGRLATVSVVGSDGHAVPGAINTSTNQWRARGLLEPSTEYRLVATSTGHTTSVTLGASFRTVTPAGWVSASLFPSDGLTVGVAQPIVFRFDHSAGSDAARAAVLSHMTVTESHPVPGGWHWFSDHELHFRPQQYWPAGEQVWVSANLSGWDAGNALWGQGQLHAHFTIGDAHVSVANLATDEMTVSVNGRIVATYPFSGGRTKYPTMNGTHIVLDRESVVHMVSSTNGIPVNSPDGYDELVYSDVHITDSGEYVHAAPWSVGSQGRANVSHGCINLSPTDALMFFNFSRMGDVVQVIGGPRPPAPYDHGVMDWDSSWSDWTPAIVHGVAPLAPAPAPVVHPSAAS